MKPINILLIEDSEGDIMLITEALEEGKITNQVTVMKNGWEAVQYLEKKGNYSNVSFPDLILLDVNLPKLNGHEVLKKIKSNEDTKHIPVIILTTSSEEKDIFEAYKNHANCFITKPILAEDFLKVVTSIEDFWISVVRLPHNPDE
ncbi:response regulator [Leptospira sp. 'Mane']|uniref:response regulator n=1 Tax=Leptospira sp. 'Mane' TaxID=3387407 RepID=UPI00398BB577